MAKKVVPFGESKGVGVIHIIELDFRAVMIEYGVPRETACHLAKAFVQILGKECERDKVTLRRVAWRDAEIVERRGLMKSKS